MTSKSEVKAEILLRQITSSAAKFIRLDQLTRCQADARIQRQFVARRPGKLEADPMIARNAFRTENGWLPFKILDDDFLDPIVEEVATRQSPSHPRNLQCLSRFVAHIQECPVALVKKELIWLAKVDSKVCLVKLRVHTAVHHDQIEPTIVVNVVECIAPANPRERPEKQP